MEEVDVTSLKEKLCDQFLIIQKLYAELEEEREASSTAVSEALSMILRLQGEKASEKMESCQYKRMAEEKMHHAEESLVVLEELLYQKEMEIASLKSEVYEYEEHFCGNSADADTCELKDPEKQASKGNNVLVHESSSSGFMRRNVSLPILRIKELRSQMDKEIASVRSAYSSPRCTNESLNKLNRMTAEGSAAAVQSRLSKLSASSAIGEVTRPVASLNALNDEEVEISENKSANDRPFSPSRAKTNDFMRSRERHETYRRRSTKSDTRYSSTTKEIEKGAETVSHSFKQVEDWEFADFDASTSSCHESVTGDSTTKSVQDIFEIPQSYTAQGEPQKFSSLRSIAEESDKHTEISESTPRKAIDYLKHDEWIKKAMLNSYYGGRSFTPRKGIVVAENWPDGTPKSSTASTWIDVEQLEKRLHMLEEDRIAMQCENSNREEQLKLLKDIHEQLKGIQCLQSDKKSRKSTPHVKSSLDSLMEAMLSFSI